MSNPMREEMGSRTYDSTVLWAIAMAAIPVLVAAALIFGR